jgi:hypothetical protein
MQDTTADNGVFRAFGLGCCSGGPLTSLCLAAGTVPVTLFGLAFFCPSARHVLDRGRDAIDDCGAQHERGLAAVTKPEARSGYVQHEDGRCEGAAALLGKQAFEPLEFVAEAAERVADRGREVVARNCLPRLGRPGGKFRLQDLRKAVLVFLGDAAIAEGVATAADGSAPGTPMITADNSEVLWLHRAGVLAHCLEQSVYARLIGNAILEQRRQW